MGDFKNPSPAGSEAGSLYEGLSGNKGPTPLAELSKEDLIQKCKKLLQIAQKAKATKDGKETIFDVHYLKPCLNIILLIHVVKVVKLIS